MDEERNNLPPLIRGDDISTFLRSDNWQDVDVEPYRLNFKKQYQAPRYTLSWNGIPFAPLGGIHAITGQAGNGKTMTLAQFMAAILCGEFGNLRYELNDEKPHPQVLYIDTEMEEANTIAVKNRVMTMCGRPIDEETDDFVVVMLREVPESVEADSKGREVRIPSSVMRWRMTLKAISEYKPTAVFIDGLLDVVADFNDNKECQETIYKCMQVASHYGISVWCIVHQNPGGEKLVGHLGSFLERKVTDVFQTKKDKNDKSGDVVFTVKQLKARGRDVEDWKFQVLPVAGWGMPEQLNVQPQEHPVGDNPADILKWINEANDNYEWPMSRADIKKIVFGEIGGQLNHGKQDADLQAAINLGYLIESTMKKKGSYMLQPPEDLPF